MTAPITLTFPMPPNLGNGRGHSRWIGVQKKRYFAAMDERQAYGLIPPPPTSPLDRVTLSAWMGLGGWMDDDNAKYRAYKWAADWLRRRGYIVDDKRPHCTMQDPEQSIVPRNQRMLEITIHSLTQETEP